MANAFLNNKVYANVMLLLLKNNLVMGRLVDGQFRDEVNDTNGLIINVKRPPRFAPNTPSALDATLDAQDIVTGSTPISVNNYAKVHIGIGDIEYVQSWNALMQNQTMKSAASRLAHQIDAYLYGLTLGFHSWVQGAGSVSVPAVPANMSSTAVDKPLSSPVQAMAAYSRLMDQGAPMNDIAAVVTPSDGLMLRGSLLSAFTPDINDDMLERTRIPLVSEIDFHESQMPPTLTTGSRTASGAALINGANQNVNYRDVAGSSTSAGWQQTIAIDTLTAGDTVAVGDVFSIAGVYAYDWRAQQALPDLAQFTVLKAATADSGGAIAALTISPPIIVTGTADATGSTKTNTAFATVDSVPANNAAISWAGVASSKYRVRPAFHKTAIALVTTRLATPFSGVSSFAVDEDTGISIRYWRISDGTTGKHYHRWDCMYGASVMDPYLGCRLTGTAL